MDVPGLGHDLSSGTAVLEEGNLRQFWVFLVT